MYVSKGIVHADYKCSECKIVNAKVLEEMILIVTFLITKKSFLMLVYWKEKLFYH